MLARYLDLAADPAATLAAALTERTRMVWLETPSNPHLKLVDLAAVARRRWRAIAAPAASGPSSSSTTPSPRRWPSGRSRWAPTSSTTRRPSTWPATRTSSTASWRRRATTSTSACAFLQNAIGAVPGPFDCFLVLRGLRTLALRMERHSSERAGRRPCAGRAPGRRGRALPRPGATGRTRTRRRPGGTADGAGRRHALLRPRAEGRPFGRRAGATPSARRPASSAWPSRSAASSRSARCRPS